MFKTSQHVALYSNGFGLTVNAVCILAQFDSLQGTGNVFVDLRNSFIVVVVAMLPLNLCPVDFISQYCDGVDRALDNRTGCCKHKSMNWMWVKD